MRRCAESTLVLACATEQAFNYVLRIGCTYRGELHVFDQGWSARPCGESNCNILHAPATDAASDKSTYTSI